VAAFITCVPAAFPANFTTLVGDMSSCVATNGAKREAGAHGPPKLIVAGLLQCVTVLSSADVAFNTIHSLGFQARSLLRSLAGAFSSCRYVHVFF
jgi:hypothetical protein